MKSIFDEMKIIIIGIMAMIGALTVFSLSFQFYTYQVNDYALSPPENLKTIEDFQKWMPDCNQVVKIMVRKSVYYLILGKNRYLPSGPSGYTFDKQGNFVEWSADIGDDRTPKIVFENIDFNRINIQEVIQEINEARKNEN